MALLILCAGAALARTARADTPIGVRVDGGIGVATGALATIRTGRAGALAAADVAWRVKDRATLLLSARIGSAACLSNCARVHLDGAGDANAPHVGVTFASVLAGHEWHRAGRVTPWVSGGVGVGRAWRSGGEGADAGLAFEVAGGWRSSEPGPPGFQIGLRTHHLVSALAQVHVLTAGIGFGVFP